MDAIPKVHNLCDALVAAYRTKGQDPSEELLPGLSDEEIVSQTAWFPGPIPQLLRELYRWRNGQANDAWNTEHVLWFRDMQFASLERARFEYQSMMQSYGVGNSRESEGIELRTSFPFASFNGGWYVLPCEGQDLDARHSLPVISVFQGIGVFFFSLEKMLQTCIEWVMASSCGGDGLELSEQAEMVIWQRHNPGVFGHAS
jgi:hypothetical protein